MATISEWAKDKSYVMYHAACNLCDQHPSVCDNCKIKVWITQGYHVAQERGLEDLNNNTRCIYGPSIRRRDPREGRPNAR